MLEAAKSWSPRVVSRLEMLLRSGTDEELYRINPIQFATEKSIAEAEAIDLFLRACVDGLSVDPTSPECKDTYCTIGCKNHRETHSKAQPCISSFSSKTAALNNKDW